PGQQLQTSFVALQSQTLTNSGTYQDTNVAATITPGSKANLIDTMWAGPGLTTSSSVTCEILLHRGATALLPTQTCTGATNMIAAAAGAYLDAPGSTSAVTYTVKVRANPGGGANVAFPYGTYGGTIMLKEIMG